MPAEHARTAVSQSGHFDLYLWIGQQLLGIARFDFDVLGVLRGRSEGHGNIARDQVTGDGNHRGVTDRPARENRHVGRARTNVHQSHAQLFFIVGEHRATRGQGVEHEHVHIQAAAAHTLHDVFCGTLRTSDDVHLGLEPNTAHANGLLHVLAIDHELLRLDEQEALIGGDIDRFGRFHHTRHIGRGHLSVLDRHHATGVDAADVAAGDAGVDPRDFAVGHQLGLFQGLLDALHGGVDIDHHAPL